MHTAFSSVPFSLLLSIVSIVSDNIIIDSIPMCCLAQPDMDTSFLLTFFGSNQMIKEKQVLTRELEAAEQTGTRNAAAFHYRYNFYEKLFNWQENDWSIRLVVLHARTTTNVNGFVGTSRSK